MQYNRKIWTPVREAQVMELEILGTPIKEMAEKLGVTEATLNQQRYRMGLTDRRRPNSLAILEATVRTTGTDDEGWCAYKHSSYPALGIAGEIGELMGEMKKIMRNDKGILTDERRSRIIDELGDVLWYAQALAMSLNTTLDTVIIRNREKLLARRETNTIKER